MSALSKVKRIPQFLTDPDFRKDVLRRRLLYPLLVGFIRRFFPNIKYFTVDDGQSLFTSKMHDRGTSWSLLVSGHLDKDHFHTSLALAEKEGRLKKNGNNIFVDAGGNIGTHTIYALRSGYFDTVIAIEPHPESFKLLEQNIAANGFSDRCRLFQCALGNVAGEVDFEVDEEHSGDHRVKVEGQGLVQCSASGLRNESARSVIKVPMRTLDEVMAESKVSKFDNVFVSIDVQGFEGHILDGAHKMIKGGAVFCIEFWPYGLNYAGAAEYLNRIIKDNFSYYYDVRDALDSSPIAAADIQKSYERYQALKFTDLLLVQDRPKASKKVA